MLAALSLSLALGITPVPHSQNLNTPFTLPDTTPIIRHVKIHDGNDNKDDPDSDSYKDMDPNQAKIAYVESRNDYHAQNGQYYGKYQLDLSYLKGDLSPENQEKVAKKYMQDRYGSWSAAWSFHQANNWW